WERIHPTQQPLLLAISTENDCATGTAFPLGQRLEFARRDRQRQALGSYEQYITHSLERITPSDASTTTEEFWYDHFESGGLQLVRRTVRQPGNPFLIARTTSDVINGHNGIWGEALRKWIVAFVL